MGRAPLQVAGRLGATPAEARRPASLSEEVSYHTGLHRTEIGQLERGLRPVRIETDALRVSVEEPLDGIVWRSGHCRPPGFTTGGED